MCDVLTRARCAILQKGFVELPSNMGGVTTILFNNHVREAVPKRCSDCARQALSSTPAILVVPADRNFMPLTNLP